MYWFDKSFEQIKHFANSFEFGIFVVGPEFVVATVPGTAGDFFEASFEKFNKFSMLVGFRRFLSLRNVDADCSEVGDMGKEAGEDSFLMTVI